jgi:hypothetical protein
MGIGRMLAWMAGRSTRGILAMRMSGSDKLEEVDATTSAKTGRSAKIIEEFRALSLSS